MPLDLFQHAHAKVYLANIMHRKLTGGGYVQNLAARRCEVVVSTQNLSEGRLSQFETSQFSRTLGARKCVTPLCPQIPPIIAFEYARNRYRARIST